jgi:UDP-glucose 4-epimerase
MKRIFVTGAAGFIGSNLVERLLDQGKVVVGWDNFSTGQERFLEKARTRPAFRLIAGDSLDGAALCEAMRGCDFVFHLAANADVRRGTEQPARDLEQNTLATFNVLEAMRANSTPRIAFASTGSIYGEATVIPTPEDAPFPVQTSLYGASKLAGEGLIEAYCTGFGVQAWIFRFVSILGERYQHGHVLDFYRKLLADSERIEVLGNGRQRKSYLYVQDCLDGMLQVIAQAAGQVNIYNLGTQEHCTVDESLSWICEEMGVRPRRCYTGGERGWIGDNPFIFLDTTRVRALGWSPRLSIRDAVLRTLRYLQENRWLLETQGRKPCASPSAASGTLAA